MPWDFDHLNIDLTSLLSVVFESLQNKRQLSSLCLNEAIGPALCLG